MECGLTNFKALRNICKCICFGTVFLWIVIGSYKRYYYDEEVEDPGGIFIPGTRKLLESSSSSSIDIYTVGVGNNKNYTIDANDEVSTNKYLCLTIDSGVYN